ncbi:MAG: thioredoxin [Bacteroidales bacterium]|nr:MAG: thioredoxin [Bacteroidales bacterium]
MLQTNLQHVPSEEEYEELLSSHENVMICCGRMGPMCIPVYRAMIELENEYEHIRFCDMAFDEPVAIRIRNLPDCRGFMGLPFTIYYRNGDVVEATGGIQTKEQIRAILDSNFPS